MTNEEQTHEGHVVDLACLRKYARASFVQRAREHTTGCLLHGHCVESGYGLVTEDDRVILLDDHATPLVVRAAQDTEVERGLRLRVRRAMRDGELRTEAVEALEP